MDDFAISIGLPVFNGVLPALFRVTSATVGTPPKIKQHHNHERPERISRQ